MSSLPAVIGLLTFVYVRPQEFFPSVRDVPALYVFLVLALIGMAHDLVERRARLVPIPMLRYVLLFGAWCIVTLIIRDPASVVQRSISAIVCVVLYVILAYAPQRIATLRKTVGAVFALGLFVAVVGFHQGLSPFQCVVYNPTQTSGVGYSDERECAMTEWDGSPHDGGLDCIATGLPGKAYRCERVGLCGTTSIGGGRVRYLGVLLDPNDLALATALAIPFAFAMAAMRRSFFRVMLLLACLVVIGGEIIFTQSRGGQLTFGMVIGVYFVKRYGWKRGVVLGAALAIPILIAGGRSDAAADGSTQERLGCAAAGIKMLMSYPFTGVGYTRYLEYHSQTAHNAFLLAAGELGLPGLWLFVFVLYLAIKIPVTVLRLDIVGPDAHAMKTLALAQVGALVGAAAGIYFLSWTYHYVLWIYFGLSGALYVVVKRAYPAYDCRLCRKEAYAIAAGCCVFLVSWSYYIMRKGAWG